MWKSNKKEGNKEIESTKEEMKVNLNAKSIKIKLIKVNILNLHL